MLQPEAEPPEAERRPPAGGGGPLAASSQRLNLAGVRVLVVDDEADARALLQRLLEDRGRDRAARRQRGRGLCVDRGARPDVLVSDIGMPEEDGYALIRQVRALPPERGGGTPAIALTAYARSEDRLKVILAGFQIHIGKAR